MALHPANYSSIHLCIWHFLLASLPIFVISAIWIVWYWKEHSKQYHLSEEDGFQRWLSKMAFKLSLRYPESLISKGFNIKFYKILNFEFC